MAYLIHYNKNHSKKNGQFISGDGDGDGTADEHHRYSKNGVSVKTEVKTGKYKPYDSKKKERYEFTTTTIEKKSGNKKTVDNLVEDSYEWFKKKYNKGKDFDFKPSELGDFTEANKIFDRAGYEAVEIYEKTGDVNKAVKSLINNIADVPYEAKLVQRYYGDKGRKEVTFYLEAYGDKYMYGTTTDSDQSDDEYFWYNEKNKEE
jgi:hypothetical protein